MSIFQDIQHFHFHVVGTNLDDNYNIGGDGYKVDMGTPDLVIDYGIPDGTQVECTLFGLTPIIYASDFLTPLTTCHTKSTTVSSASLAPNAAPPNTPTSMPPNHAELANTPTIVASNPDKTTRPRQKKKQPAPPTTSAKRPNMTSIYQDKLTQRADYCTTLFERKDKWK